jgi:hypothetical protein
MVRVLVAKFTQHVKACDVLLSSAPQRLVFTRKDNYWGIGRDGKTGANKLGVLLAVLREKLLNGGIPRNGLCTACSKADVWVSSVSAKVFPYCSPGCRVRLGLPAEVPAEDDIEAEVSAQMAGSQDGSDSSRSGSTKGVTNTVSAVLPMASGSGRTSPARRTSVTGPKASSGQSTPRSARSSSPLARGTPRKSIVAPSSLNPARK